MSVSVLIVNYNGAKFIKDCLDSVLKSECSFPLDIICIDNASTDHSLDVLVSYKDRITVIQNKHNSGFSKGNNIAADYAKGEMYFLLNNDTVVRSDTIQKLYDFMVGEKHIGALVPKLLNEDGTIQCPGSILGQWKFKSPSVQDVSFVAGAALLMHKNVYEEIKGLDENLFFYNDDIDLCKTLKRQGYRLVYYPKAELTHFGGLSTQFRKVGSLIEGYRGGFYVCRKHYGVVAFLFYRILVLVDILPRLCFHCLLSIVFKTHRDFVRVYFQALLIDITGNIYVDHPPVDVKVL